MNWVIARITLRQLLSRRRTLLLLLLGGVLVLVAGIFRLAGEEARALPFTSGLLGNLGIGTLMPLVALIFGTGAIGAEIEDWTAISCSPSRSAAGPSCSPSLRSLRSARRR